MKTVLKMGAAALALSLMATASAFAQAGQTNGSPAMESQSGQAMSSQGAAAAPGDMSTSAAETADTPAGSPPSTYPVCKHKGEDRCIQEASIGGSHHMRHHMMKAKKSTDAASDTSGAAAPATPPAQ